VAVTWLNFYTLVQPHVPGCPEIVIDQHLQEAAADFCARSEVWRFDIERGYTFRGVSDYDVDVPQGAVLENVTSLFLDGGRLAQLADVYAAPNPTTPPAAPTHYGRYEDQQIRFFPTPDARYEYRGSGVLKPKLTATGVEDFIYETHGRSIACGAIASLTIIPGKEWTNPELALYYRTKFIRDCDDAKRRDLRRTTMRVRGRTFA
jgi:hypothetical protein